MDHKQIIIDLEKILNGLIDEHVEDNDKDNSEAIVIVAELIGQKRQEMKDEMNEESNV